MRTKVDRKDRAAEDQCASPEPVAPLQVSVNRWTRGAAADDEENVERKVRALLNKLTMEKFDTISDQIIEWGRTLGRSSMSSGWFLRQLARLRGWKCMRDFAGR
jgi:hypothetical protein